ncbi:MAG: hypothetical protein EAZ17_01010 [Sphingobacteriales bacterium]|jgi:hypothetical protein|nr:MAG: hypothetical protein EAZ17_01010 [Sphingobacteriales bacterium]
MRAGKMTIWMIVCCTALVLSAWIGIKGSKSQEAAPEKEICKEPAQGTALKRASLQLWENIVKL